MKYDLNIDTSIGKDGLNPGMYPVIIYQLIRQYSNETNKITPDDILETLGEYWKGDTSKASSKTNLQKTLKRNIESLLYFDSNIHAEYKDGTPFHVDSGDSVGKIKFLWYEQELSSTELQLLSDAVVYSKHLSPQRSLDIIEKLMRIAGQPVNDNPAWYKTLLEDTKDLSQPVSGDLYNKLEYVNEAITAKLCLSFSFSYFGPNNKQYVVDSYTGVSPYKILHNNGIYYMVASKNPSDIKDIEYKYNKGLSPITYFAIHKMTKVVLDYDSKYTDISKTAGSKYKINNLLNIDFLAPMRDYSKNRFKNDLQLIVSSRGLDVLIDRFGDRLRIKKRKEKDSRYDGSTPELTYTYMVDIDTPTPNDYNIVLELLLYYSDIDITLENKQFLQWVKSLMEIRLKRLENKNADV